MAKNRNDLGGRMKGQLSAEMVILIAVILAVVAIVAIAITSTANKGSSTLGQQSDYILNSTSGIVANFSTASEDGMPKAMEPIELSAR